VLVGQLGSRFQGHVDYTAAIAFLDAFASFRSTERPGKTVAINWCVWRDVGMAARVAPARRGGNVTGGTGNRSLESLQLNLRTTDHRERAFGTGVSSAASLADEALRQGIEPSEGIAAFERVLACGVVPQIIVSSVDLQL
jgi:hypothetical protein